MTEKLQQTIKEELAKLPKENRDIINSLDWVKVAEGIGKKYLLNESEINDLQVETLLVLIGLEDLDFYAENVENNVGTSKNEADKIANEVIEKIFIPIGNALEENIKKSGKVKNGNAEQNLNFVLSGGDYSAFMEQNPPRLDKEGTGVVIQKPLPDPSPLATNGEGRRGEANSNPPPHPNPLLKGEGGPIIPVFSIKEENLKDKNKI